MDIRPESNFKCINAFCSWARDPSINKNLEIQSTSSFIYTSLHNEWLPAYLFYNLLPNDFVKRYSIIKNEDNNEKVITYYHTDFVMEVSLENITPSALILKNWEKFGRTFKESSYFKIFKIASIPHHLMVAKNTIFYPTNEGWKPLFMLCIKKDAILNLKTPNEEINSKDIVILISNKIKEYDKLLTFIRLHYFDKYLEDNINIIFTKNISEFCYNKTPIVTSKDFKDIPSMMDFLNGENDLGIYKELKELYGRE